jgi:hypothetical protein
MTSKGLITSAQETVAAAGKGAAEGAKALAGEVANAAATAKAVTTAAVGVVLDKIAKTIEASKPSSETVVAVGQRAAVGAKAFAHGAAALAEAGVTLEKFAKTMLASKPSSETAVAFGEGTRRPQSPVGTFRALGPRLARGPYFLLV